MAEDILETIAARTRKRIEEEKALCPLEEMQAKARRAAEDELASRAREGHLDANGQAQFTFPFLRALKGAGGMAFICEVKKASPSKGIIAESFPYLEIAQQYEAAGAAAISCLTEPFWFKGSDAYLQAIAEAVTIPVLRKDFVVDEYMIYQAKALGAQAVLLIVSLLDDEELGRFSAIAESLGLSALVEAHDEREIERACAAGARIIGVNNRNLRDFTVDLGRAHHLRALIPADVVYVAESGVSSPDDVATLAQEGVDAVLVGEALMRAADKGATLAAFKEAAR